MHFSFKICKTVAGIIRMSKFPEFFNLIFGGFLPLDPTVLRKVEASRQCSGQFHHTSMTIEVKVVDQKCDN